MTHQTRLTAKRAARPSAWTPAALAAAALIIASCSEPPENCGDGQKLDTHNEFCHDGKAYKKCGGAAYNPDAKFCSADNLYDKCGGWEYDPLREFCGTGKVYVKCGGDTYDPALNICFFGNLSAKCGSNWYDPVNQTCQTGIVLDKCGGLVPTCQDTARPKCGTEFYDTTKQTCSANKLYDHCGDGSPYNPETGCSNVKTNPKCNGAAYNDAQKFCFYGISYDKCGGRDYDPRTTVCVNSTPVSMETAAPDSSGTKFKLTVSSEGAGASEGGSYAAGTKVTIKAGTVAEQQFINWTWTAPDGVVIFANADTANTTFIMPGYNATVKANFARTYLVTISSINTNATGGGRYPAGDSVYIRSGTAPAGLTFLNWTVTSGGVTLGNTKSANTSFKMPATPVALTVVFAVEDSRDKAVYKVAKIGNQIWMGQNLNYKPTSGSSWCYNNDEADCNKYGRLYSWPTAMNGAEESFNNPSGVRGICPAGWHFPSGAEWNVMIAVPGEAVAGTKLKAKSPNWNGTDDYGFTALIGHGRTAEGEFFNASCWWTPGGSGSYTGGKPYVRFLHTDSSRVLSSTDKQGAGYYIRCVKD